MNVLLIDDHFCVRDGIASLLRIKFDNLQVFEADSIEIGLDIAKTVPLNLVLLDIGLPEQDGLSGLHLLRTEFPALSVVMFSAYDNRQVVLSAIDMGAMGFISKTLPRLLFEEALQDVLSGKVFLPPSVVLGRPKNAPVSGFLPLSDPEHYGLTNREFETLKLLVMGLSNKSIAKHMDICEQTVKNYVTCVFRVFKVKSRTELMAALVVMGIVLGAPEVGNNLVLA